MYLSIKQRLSAYPTVSFLSTTDKYDINTVEINERILVEWYQMIPAMMFSDNRINQELENQ